MIVHQFLFRHIGNGIIDGGGFRHHHHRTGACHRTDAVDGTRDKLHVGVFIVRPRIVRQRNPAVQINRIFRIIQFGDVIRAPSQAVRQIAEIDVARSRFVGQQVDGQGRFVAQSRGDIGENQARFGIRFDSVADF